MTKAVFFTEHGGQSTCSSTATVPTPEPGRGRGAARGAGGRAQPPRHLRPQRHPGRSAAEIPGGDGAGVVDADRRRASRDSRPGDRVLIQPGLFCGACEFCRAGEQSLCVTYRILGEHVAGTFAEQVVVPARNVFPIPGGSRSTKAAAFPLAYQTAWRMIVGRAAVRPGETVLIHGAGRGRGRRGASRSRGLAGARVLATTSGEEKVAAVREAGAELVVDYTDGGRPGRACAATPASAAWTSSSTPSARRRG